jgi:hypothetical protein
MSRSHVSREALFRILAVLFAGAAVYHAVAFFDPAFSDGGAHWRHAVFCAIDLLFAWYILRRPRWFLWAFGLLTLETLWSHGSRVEAVERGGAAGLAFLRGSDRRALYAGAADSRRLGPAIPASGLRQSRGPRLWQRVPGGWKQGDSSVSQTAGGDFFKP